MTTGLRNTGKTVSGGPGLHIVEGAIQDGYATPIGHGDPVTIVGGFVVICPETAVPTHVLRGVKWVDGSTGELRMSHWYPGGLTNAGTIDGVTDIIAILEPVQGRRFNILSNGSVTRAVIGTLRRLTTNTPNATGGSVAVVNIAGAVTTELRLVRVLGLAPGASFGTNSELEVEVVDPDAVS